MNTFTISSQKLDDQFLDDHTNHIEELSKTMKFSDIKTITLNDVQLDPNVFYDIFQGFVNLKTLNIFNSHITSRTLSNVLHAVNPYALTKLDLTGSVFDEFKQSDITELNSLFGLTLIPPANMNESDKEFLAGVLGGY